MPSTSCAQPRKVCQLASVQTSSLVTQGQHPLMVWCWGEGRRGMKPCHHQYSNGGHFWAVDLIKALPGAFHPKLSGRHVHQPHCTERISCSETPSLTEDHTARKWQRWNWNPILNPLPCTLRTSGELWAADNWENGRTGVYSLTKTVFITNACIRLLGAFI